MKLLLKCLLLIVILAAADSARAGYRVQNGRIYDDNNIAVQLRGANWFGFEVPDHVVHGLWARNWKSMISQMKATGFNAVRLPFCPASLQTSSVSTVNYSFNPDLQNKNSREVLDLVVNEFNAQGMYILMDHHRPDCNAISELWYTAGYSEQQWIDDLVFVANRYKKLPYFLGVDLKNEPHGAATWGTNNLNTDWNKAAERAASQILANAPNILIFVEGIQENPSCSNGQFGHFWGENLEPLACTPLNIPTNRLVLSPHVYGPDVYDQPYFQVGNFPANMPAIWNAHFGQFVDAGYAVVVGEFGGKYGHGGNPRDVIWQNAFVDYLISKNMRGGFYWSWNANSGDTGGILQDDWQTIWQDKVNLLSRLWFSPTAASVTIAGRVTNAQGRAVAGARIFLTRTNGGAARNSRTNSSGYYRFSDVSAGDTYVFEVRHKLHHFNAQTVFVTEELGNLNFAAMR